MATYTENLQTFFTGDSAGYEAASKRVDAAVSGNARNEKIASDAIRRLREQRVKEAALEPIRAKEAADRMAKVNEQKAKDEAGRVERQRKASSFSNIAKELRANSGDNARRKIGSFLTDKLAISTDAAQGLVKKLGMAAPYIGAAAVAGVALVKTFKAASNFAGEQAEKMRDLSAEMQATSRINIFTSSAEGVDSLSEKLSKVRQEIREAKEAQIENDPFGFGGGIIGDMATVLGKKMQSGMNFAANFANVAGGDSNFDKQAREKENLRLQQMGANQQFSKLTKERTEAVQRELDVTKARLGLDQQTVAINDLQLQKEREIKSERFATLSQDDKEKVKARFDVQMTAQDQLRTAMAARFNLEQQLQSLQLTSLSTQQRGLQASQMRLEQVKKELDTRRYITTEERRSLTAEMSQERTQIVSATRSAQERSGASFNREFYRQRRRANQIKRDDRQTDRNDGLINVERGMDGEIIGGTDRLTGKYRKSTSKTQFQGLSETGFGGLSSGGLSTSGTRGSLFGGADLFEQRSNMRRFGLDPNAKMNPADMKGGSDHGSNDQAKQNTLLGNARAQIDATNISNDYLKQIQVDISTIRSDLMLK